MGAESDATRQMLALYDEALPEVYGYFMRRCDRGTADVLTEQTFVTAMDIATGTQCDVGGPWLLGIARWTLGDHFRQRPDRYTVDATSILDTDDWDAHLNRELAETVLARLSEPHRTVLTLRYVDDRPLTECAELLHLDLSDTEALLLGARRAFRALYPTGEVT